jgi:hypothetical protein
MHVFSADGNYDMNYRVSVTHRPREIKKNCRGIKLLHSCFMVNLPVARRTETVPSRQGGAKWKCRLLPLHYSLNIISLVLLSRLSGVVMIRIVYFQQSQWSLETCKTLGPGFRRGPEPRTTVLARANNWTGLVKLSLCLTKHYAMKTYGGVDV